jgi:thymidylate synthase (FAD)
MIEIIRYTENPIQEIGKMAGICWGADTKDKSKNCIRGMDILKAGHGEPIEFPEIVFTAEEYSIRVFRELLRHRHTTKLQQSTRYVNEKNFNYFIPKKIKNNELAIIEYVACIENCRKTYERLLNLGITKEDAANILPLGTHSKVVMKINLRELIHVAGLRLCGKAYEEINTLIEELKIKIQSLDFEWAVISDKFLTPKCVQSGKCTEKVPCQNF